MGINYTPAQKRAIYERDKSLLLSAAAGSGKTAVLVARILDIISDEKNDINITDLLIVTFTNLAAAQMKERIYKEITERIKEFPQNKKLKKQLIYLSNAKIKTIHGFCLDIIKENIDLVDIPVNFRIADANETASLKQKVLTEFTEKKYEQYDEAFIDIMDTYAYSRTDDNFAELILNIEKDLDSMADKDKFISNAFDTLNEASEDFSKSVYAQIITSHVRLILKDTIRKYTVAVKKAELSPDFDQYPPFFREERRFMEDLCNEEDIFEIKNQLEKYSSPFPAIPKKKTGTDTAFFTKVRDVFKNKAVKNILSALNIPKETEESFQKEIIVHIRNLIKLVTEFQGMYKEEKHRKGILDFNDFEHMAYSLLKNENDEPSALCENLQKSYYEILIDEYQDTSDLQNSIFELISDGGKNLFMVGDVKQSIYKFRYAKPELFIEKSEAYEKDGKNAELIMLSENFRSRPQVIDSVNRVFSDIMTKETSMTDYTKEMLVNGAYFPEAENTDYKTEVLLFSGSNSMEGDCCAEGMMIAQRIKELKDSKFSIYDRKTDSFRPVEYSDIVILTRDMKADAKGIYNTLMEKGIPVSCDLDGGFYSYSEVLTIINILKAIDNPYNDLCLLALLKSPAFHFTETELLEIRLLDDYAPYYDALKKSDCKKALSAVSFLKEFEEKASKSGVSQVVSDIYTHLKLSEKFASFENFEQRLYHLDVFHKVACEYERNQGGGLKGFIYHIEKASKNLKKVRNVYENKNLNSVKILTMHSSKGLEFPVVFVSALHKSVKMEDNKKKVLIHADAGIGADYVSKKEQYVTATLAKSAIRIKEGYEQISEELRILYVAMTRAKEKLILTSAVSNLEDKLVYWETVNAAGGHTLNTLNESSCFLDWLMPSAQKSPFFNIKTTDMFFENEIQAEALELTEALPVNHAVFMEYPETEKTSLPLKVTVSYANKLKKDDEDFVPRFSLEELDSHEDSYSGSEFGTYFHKMFELCDISAIKSGKNVKTVINDLIENGLLEETPYSDEATAGIENFFKTDLGQSLLESECIKKESPFLVRINADEIFGGKCKDEILLQGATDCYFTDNSGITLVDFKTDKNPNEEKIRKNYSNQIMLYAYALEKVTGLKVTKKVIYTVRNANIIEI